MKQSITYAERVNTGVAQVSYRGEVPESGYRGEVPESGYRGEVPESGYRGEVPESGYRGEVPESGYRGEVPESGYRGEVPESGYRGEVPESGYRGEVPESGYRGEVPESGYRGEVPESGYRMAESVIDTLEYRDGTSFTFRFVPMNGGQYYQVDILDQPDYEGRPEDGHSTHRYSLNKPDSSHYICFGNPQEVGSLSKAKDYAQDWANHTYKYIHWGERF